MYLLEQSFVLATLALWLPVAGHKHWAYCLLCPGAVGGVLERNDILKKTFSQYSSTSILSWMDDGQTLLAEGTKHVRHPHFLVDWVKLVGASKWLRRMFDEERSQFDTEAYGRISHYSGRRSLCTLKLFPSCSPEMIAFFFLRSLVFSTSRRYRTNTWMDQNKLFASSDLHLIEVARS